MNEKIGAEEAWQLVKARELNEDLDSRDYFDAGFEAGKHLPSGDVVENLGPIVPWGDKPDKWTEEIEKANPANGADDTHYVTALEMVSNRHGKYELVALVNWLLVRAASVPANPPQVDATLELAEWLTKEIGWRKKIADPTAFCMGELSALERVQGGLVAARKEGGK